MLRAIREIIKPAHLIAVRARIDQGADGALAVKLIGFHIRLVLEIPLASGFARTAWPVVVFDMLWAMGAGGGSLPKVTTNRR
ncbi:hypothetical protein BST17_24810 [Mycolicibacterium bacteremicum]|uniref:Uncharacterized protein n=1 Tax=Mycolicibacterium bacteremicum TaxID=564198 RepID=A0A1W9YQ27_MYCBA|nr:hypothetical protein BST17_24810 [Mycolicibacterium bacteremicum]